MYLYLKITVCHLSNLSGDLSLGKSLSVAIYISPSTGVGPYEISPINIGMLTTINILMVLLRQSYCWDFMDSTLLICLQYTSNRHPVILAITLLLPSIQKYLLSIMVKGYFFIWCKNISFDEGYKYKYLEYSWNLYWFRITTVVDFPTSSIISPAMSSHRGLG